jgi:hypothetical protein
VAIGRRGPEPIIVELASGSAERGLVRLPRMIISTRDVTEGKERSACAV